ncbi:MAG: glycosyltransferase family 4 protein, partial [Paraglaciecola sp.]|nr:glycosyltransferase family 4 protein [Paraglaciecola sp.]
FRQVLISRGVCSEKIHLVYNWCPEEQRIADVLAHSEDRSIETAAAKFVYAGNLGSAQALKTMIKALGSFDDSKLTFTLIGGGVEKNALEKFVTDSSFSNIFFGDYVPASQIFNVLASADVLVIHLKDDDLFRITIPSKTQSSMAMGKPILMAVGGEANQLLIEAEGGEVAEPEDESSIREAANRLLATRQTWSVKGKNARAFYQRKLSMDVNFKKLLTVITEAVK